MTGWPVRKIAEVVHFLNASRIPLKSSDRAKRQGLFPYYGASGVVDWIDDFIFEGRYLLVSEDGQNLESRQAPIAFIASGRFWVNNHAHILDEREPGILDYLSRSLNHTDFSAYITGAAQPKLSKRALMAVSLPIPPLSERLEINAVLNALDDKIENNRKTAATLEEMARALYRSWFVDFDPVHAKAAGEKPAFMDEETAALFPDRFGDDGLPEGWADALIYGIADVKYGAPFSSKLFNREGKGRPLVRIRDLKAHQAGVYTTEIHNKEYMIQPGDIVVGMDGDFTPHTWSSSPALMNQRVCSFKPERKENRTFLRFAIEPLLKGEEEAAVATTVIHLGKKDIDKFTVIIATGEVLHAFARMAEPLLSRQVSVGLENRCLVELRDSLLPKLMSGEIRVGEAREQVEEVT